LTVDDELSIVVVVVVVVVVGSKVKRSNRQASDTIVAMKIYVRIRERESTLSVIVVGGRRVCLVEARLIFFLPVRLHLSRAPASRDSEISARFCAFSERLG
jgi:hypothetical protein